MKHFLVSYIILLATTFFFSGCGASTNIVGEWQADDYVKGNIKKILIVGVVDPAKPILRKRLEDGLKGAIINKNVVAISSIDVMPSDVKLSKENFQEYFKGENIDAVIVSRLISVDVAKEYLHSQYYTLPEIYYSGFYGYYNYSYQGTLNKSRLNESVNVVIETNVFDVETEKLVWNGISETIDATKPSEVINSLADNLANKLNSEGYFNNK